MKARRSAESPFRHIPKVNAEVDVRHRRRPLSAEEFTRLIEAARAGGAFRGLAGPDRAVLYTVAGMTGLRAKELASLSPRSFALDADPPVVVVEPRTRSTAAAEGGSGRERLKIAEQTTAKGDSAEPLGFQGCEGKRGRVRKYARQELNL